MNKTRCKHFSTRTFGVGAFVLAVCFLLFFCGSALSGCGTRKPDPSGGEPPAQTTDDLYQIPGMSTLDKSDELALKQYAYEELSDTLVTMRADTMYVTERNIARPTPQILSDTYTVSANYTTSEGGVGTYTNDFTFTRYPSPGHSLTANMFTAEASALGVSPDQYLTYYRYMLLSHGYSITQEASRLSASGELTQSKLYKHPAIDLQYGAVEGTDNAVEKVIVVDPSYRSLHVTGLYLPAGEAISVKVEGLEKGKKVSFRLGEHNSMAWIGGVNGGVITSLGGTVQGGDSNNRYFKNNDFLAAAAVEKKSTAVNAISIHNHLQSKYPDRLPWLLQTITFDHDGEYTVGSPLGGLIMLSPENNYSEVKLTVRGAVETPHYILGVTTPAYFDTYLRNAPGVYSVMDTENGQLVGISGAMRTIKTEEIDKLATLWHSFFAVNESFTGGKFDRKNYVKFDYHVPAGDAVALGNYEYACPMSWYYNAMNYQGLLSGGQWGILHEVGHSHGGAYGYIWGFGDGREGEVRNNALTCLAYIKMLDIGTTRDANGNIGAEHGFVAHPYSNLRYSLQTAALGKNDWINNDYFQMLSMYVNIMHSFGVDKFYEMLHTYKAHGGSYVAAANAELAKRADFIYRCALIYKQDFRAYCNDMYKARVTDDLFTEEQLAELNALESYQPIANLYAGGIDGLHTGGDWRVNYGADVIFDLQGKTISSGTFEIVEVEQPAIGRLIDLGDGRWQYAFAERSYAQDEFSFTVRLQNGQKHKMTVWLRISGNTSEIRHYDTVSARELDASQAETALLTPVVTAQAGGGVASFNNIVRTSPEVKISRFLFKAKDSGVHTFYLKADDKAILRIGDAVFGNMTEKIRIERDQQNFSEQYKFSVTLSADEMISFEIYLLNNGGGGFAVLGLLFGAEEGVANNLSLPADQVFHPAFAGQSLPESYVFAPKFLISQKAGLTFGTLSSPKSEWKVLAAPLHHGGNTHIEIMYDEKTGEEIRVEVDKSNYLIDDQAGTIYHTAYGNETVTPMPHEFVIDTAMQQSFNFFEIATRSNGNSYIYGYELYISDTYGAEGGDDWRLVKSASGETGDRLVYNNLVARLTFPQVDGRYWKLTVRSTSGANSGKPFTVIAELNAGIQAQTQRVVPLTNADFYTTSGWVDSRNVENLQNGFLYTESKNEKLGIRFKGDRISLYANKGVGYGSAQVYVDGKAFGVIDLHADAPAQKRLVFSREGLSDEEHVVEIVTLTNSRFNLNFAGVSYETEILDAPLYYQVQQLLEREQELLSRVNALVIALVVFVLLFTAVTTLFLLAVFMPGFRNAVFGNKLMRWYDKWYAASKEKRDEKKAAQKKAAAEEKAKAESARAAKPTPPNRNVDVHAAVRAKLAADKAKAATAPKASESRTENKAGQARPAPKASPAQPAARPASTQPARPAQSAVRPAAQPVRPAPSKTPTRPSPADKNKK